MNLAAPRVDWTTARFASQPQAADGVRKSF
jgi:hypothetical protein